jgi:hypothetical protein
MIGVFEATRMRRPPDRDDERKDLENPRVSSAPPLSPGIVEVALFMIPGAEERGSNVIDIRQARPLGPRAPASRVPGVAPSGLAAQVEPPVPAGDLPNAPDASLSQNVLFDLPLRADVAEMASGMMPGTSQVSATASEDEGASESEDSFQPEWPADGSALEEFPVLADVATSATPFPVATEARPPLTDEQASPPRRGAAAIWRAAMPHLTETVARFLRTVALLANPAARVRTGGRRWVLVAVNGLHGGQARLRAHLARLPETVAPLREAARRRVSDDATALRKSVAHLVEAVGRVRKHARLRTSDGVTYLRANRARLRAALVPLREEAHRQVPEAVARLRQSLARMPALLTPLLENASRRTSDFAAAAAPLATNVARLSKRPQNRAAFLTASLVLLAIVVAPPVRAPLIDAPGPSAGETADSVAGQVPARGGTAPVARLAPGKDGGPSSDVIARSGEVAARGGQARRPATARAIPTRTVARPVSPARWTVSNEQLASASARSNAGSGRSRGAPAAPGAIDGRPPSPSPGVAADPPPALAGAPDVALARDTSPGTPATGAPVLPTSGTAPESVTKGRSPTNQGADADAIAEVLRRLQLAYARLDPNLARTVWPTVNVRALGRAFDGLRIQHVSFDRCRVNLQGGMGEAECRRLNTYVPRAGRRYSRTESRQWVFRFKKVDDRWVIASAAAR